MNFLETEPSAPPKLSADGLQSLFASSPLAMLIEDEDGCVKDANDAAVALFQGERAEIVGRHAAEVLPPRLGHQGSPREVRKGVLMTSGGQALGVTVLNVPVALGLEEATLVTIWESEESAPRTARDLEPFLSDSNVSSELQGAAGRIGFILNHHLTAIQGFASLAQETLKNQTIYPEHLDGIVEAARETAEVAKELLEFSSQHIANPAPVDAGALLDSMQSRLEQAGGEGVELKVDLEDSLPEVMIDADGFCYVLEQLVRDSAASLAEGGRIEVRAMHNAESEEVRVTVRDNGVGLRGDHRRRAFEPFFVADSSSKSTGLGLALAKSRAEAIGCGLELESEVGEGAIYTLIIAAQGEAGVTPQAQEEIMETNENSIEALAPLAPLAPVTAASEPAAAVAVVPVAAELSVETAPEPEGTPAGRSVPKRQVSRGGKETILVVEDEEMVRDLVKRSLGYLGYEVIDACNGEEGLAVARQRRDEIDMVFTDIVMPRMSGPEMVANMTEEKLELPVLYTTGFTDNKRLLDNGEIREGVNLLPKPYTTKVLAARVREVLDGLIG